MEDIKMGYNESKLQAVRWKNGDMFEHVAAHSSETTEEHAKELAKHIKGVNPEIAISTSKAGSGYRVNIVDDVSLKKFEETFAVKVEKQRQHIERIRKGHETSSKGHAL